jgi:hypothetical protein
VTGITRFTAVTGFARFVTVLVAAAAIGLMGVLLGAWWAPFPVAVAAGILLPKARWALLAGAVAGLAAWGIPLEGAQLQFGLGPTARSFAAIMGFNGAATIPVALTLLVGLLLGFSGSWLGSAGRTIFLVRPPRGAMRRPAVKAEAPAQPVSARR